MTIFLILSAQCFIQPVQKSLFLRLDGGAQALRQLLEQFTLFLGELGRYGDVDDHQLIAAATAPQVRYPFVFEVEDLARLRPRGDLQLLIAVQCWNVDLRAERRLGNIDIQIQKDVVLAAFEELM